MFVQVITAPIGDVEAIKRAMERWVTERRPQAKGFLGMTGGVSTQNVFVAVARFENEDLARQNSDDPGQTAWWNELSKAFADDATFHDCTEVDITGPGGSDEAGFVQVIQGRARDKAAVRSSNEQFEQRMRDARPDIIGGLTAWDGDIFTDVIYFTSEAEARAGEAKELPADLQAEFERWQSLMEDVRFYDLTEPQLLS